MENWVEQGISRIACLPWDTAVGLRWAKLLADLRRRGQAIPIKDSLIAATALIHDLTVVTRNVSDFEAAAVRIVNPFA